MGRRGSSPGKVRKRERHLVVTLSLTGLCLNRDLKITCVAFHIRIPVMLVSSHWIVWDNKDNFIYNKGGPNRRHQCERAVARLCGRISRGKTHYFSCRSVFS